MQILQTIPANTVALEGAVWDGSQFLSTRGDGQPIHPFTTVRTKQGTAQWPQFAPPRANSTAVSLNHRRSIFSGDAELWLQCEAAGTTAASAPVINYSQIGTTVVDGTVTWRVKGLHAFKGFANWPARTNLLVESTIPSSLTNWVGGGFTYSAANAFIPGTSPVKITQDNTGSFRSRGQTIGTFTAAQSDTFFVILENIDAVTSTISVYDNTAVAHVARAEITWATESVIAIAGTIGTSLGLHVKKLTNVGPNGGKVYRIGVSGVCPNAGNVRRALIYPLGVGQNALSVVVHHAQFEANATFPSPPIITTTATVTRAATNLSIPTAGVIRSNDFGVDMWVIPGGLPQIDARLWGSIVDGNNYLYLIMDNTGMLPIVRRTVGGVVTQQTTLALASNAPNRVQAVFRQGFIDIRGMVLGGTWSSWASVVSASSFVPPPTHAIGNSSVGFGHMAGNYPATRFILHSNPKAELERLAAIDDLWTTGQI